MRLVLPVKKIIRFAFSLSFAVTLLGINSPSLVQAQDKNTASLSGFELVTANGGWVLLDGQLFWTSDAGQTWREIGPAVPEGALIQDVQFKDGDTGWVLWTT